MTGFLRMLSLGFLCLFLGTLFLGTLSTATAQPLGHGSTLERLTMPIDGGLVHYSSYDRTGGNDDFVVIEPGETHVMFDHAGAGVVRRWWITIRPRNNEEVQRQLIVRCFWDGQAEPSVEVPVSDFFGMGFGQWKDFQSLPLNMTSGGYNTYWAMPFKERGRCLVENTSAVLIERYYYNIDLHTYDELPEETLYFHAQYRQAVTERDVPYTVLDTEGRGHYVGTLLSMQPRQGNALGYLEGDQRLFIDGEATPSIIGTGTEDYFSSGWYYDTGEYSAPYHGIPIKDEATGRIVTYRWHIEDPIPFQERFLFTIEHGGTNDTPDVDYSSVAFWYQTPVFTAFPALPDNLLPYKLVTAPTVEGEDLLEQGVVTGGRLTTQNLGGTTERWGGGAHLWWVEAEPGDRLTLPLSVDAAGPYDLTGFFTRAGDYGIVRVSVNGAALRPLVDGYSRIVEPTGPVRFGEVSMRAGLNEITIEILGKHQRSAGYSDGYLVGIDGFSLVPVVDE
ncbi:MAG: DUF2961 domain-containing protein [Bacteroidota bacterium]